MSWYVVTAHGRYLTGWTWNGRPQWGDFIDAIVLKSTGDDRYQIELWNGDLGRQVTRLQRNLPCVRLAELEVKVRGG